MKKRAYEIPTLQTIKVGIMRPLALSGEIDDGGTIGGGGNAGETGNPPLDAPGYKSWSDIWNENENL